MSKISLEDLTRDKMKYLVWASCDPEVVTMMESDIGDGEEQYATIFDTEVEALKYVIEFNKEEAKRWLENSHSVSDQWQRAYYLTLLKHDPKKLTTMAPWHADLIEEVTAGKVTAFR